jgi:hypothetical protein
MTLHAAYRHVQTYWTLWVILVATGGVASLLISLEPGGDALAGTLVMAACLLGSLLCLGRLVIEVHADTLRWSFGYVGWPNWSLPLSEVARLEVTRADVFGSGIKGPARHRRYTVTMGGPALRLHLHDGRSVTLGTPDPQRLASFVQARLPASRR